MYLVQSLFDPWYGLLFISQSKLNCLEYIHCSEIQMVYAKSNASIFCFSGCVFWWQEYCPGPTTREGTTLGGSRHLTSTTLTGRQLATTRRSRTTAGVFPSGTGSWALPIMWKWTPWASIRWGEESWNTPTASVWQWRLSCDGGPEVRSMENNNLANISVTVSLIYSNTM